MTWLVNLSIILPLVHCPDEHPPSLVRLEPTIIELERERDDLLIIGHASVIRCLLAYLMGLPAHEVPAVEIARGDLVEVVPASYGVHSQAFHFWSGPGRGVDGEGQGDQENFYENYAEATQGKKKASGDDFGGGPSGAETPLPTGAGGTMVGTPIEQIPSPVTPS